MPLRSPSAWSVGLAERDADVLDRVVLIDVEVAGGVQREVEAAVPREQLQHVIEKTDAGADVVASLAVEDQPAANLRFGRPPIERRRSRRSAQCLPRSASSSLADSSRDHHRFERLDGGLRVLDHPRRHPNAPRRHRILRPIPDMNLPGGKPFDERSCLADTNHDVVGSARPVLQIRGDGRPHRAAHAIPHLCGIRGRNSRCPAPRASPPAPRR